MNFGARGVQAGSPHPRYVEVTNVIFSGRYIVQWQPAAKVWSPWNRAIKSPAICAFFDIRDLVQWMITLPCPKGNEAAHES